MSDSASFPSFEKDLLTELLYKYRVVVVGKSYCPHTRKVKAILTSNYGLVPSDEFGAVPEPVSSTSTAPAASANAGELLCFFDLDTDPRVQTIEEARRSEGEARANSEDEISRFQDVLQTLTDGRRTVPCVFIGSRFVGGESETTKMDENGSLAILLREAGLELPVPSSSAGAKSPQAEAADAGSHHAFLSRHKVPLYTGGEGEGEAAGASQPRQPQPQPQPQQQY